MMTLVQVPIYWGHFSIQEADLICMKDLLVMMMMMMMIMKMMIMMMMMMMMMMNMMIMMIMMMMVVVCPSTNHSLFSFMFQLNHLNLLNSLS